MTTDSKTLELIARLHALATNKGATEAEAATALSKMQALLFKHNLTMSDISMDPSERKSSITDEESSAHDIIATWFGGRVRPAERAWLSLLAGSVARYNFCSTMITKKFTHVWFVGTPENIAAVRAIWMYAAEQVMDLADEAYKAYKAHGGTTYYRIWRRNFATGCCARLEQRLREEWNKLQQANVDSKALIVVNSTDLTEYIDARKDSKPVKYNTGRSVDGQRAGYVAGDLVKLGAKAKEIK